MPIFRNLNKDMYALVSYKVLYSKFSDAANWIELGSHPSLMFFMRSLFQRRSHFSLFLLRSPYDRVVSCFMDKFRKQPMRISEPGFQWQACHKLAYPYCGITERDDDKDVASRFLELSFDSFLGFLPEIYKYDGHYQPQFWSSKIVAGNLRVFTWPGCKILRVEDAESLSLIPDIDFSIRSNSTNHLIRDFEITPKNKETIKSLYFRDFLIGGYSL